MAKTPKYAKNAERWEAQNGAAYRHPYWGKGIIVGFNKSNGKVLMRFNVTRPGRKVKALENLFPSYKHLTQDNHCSEVDGSVIAPTPTAEAVKAGLEVLDETARRSKIAEINKALAPLNIKCGDKIKVAVDSNSGKISIQPVNDWSNCETKLVTVIGSYYDGRPVIDAGAQGWVNTASPRVLIDPAHKLEEDSATKKVIKGAWAVDKKGFRFPEGSYKITDDEIVKSLSELDLKLGEKVLAYSRTGTVTGSALGDGFVEGTVIGYSKMTRFPLISFKGQGHKNLQGNSCSVHSITPLLEGEGAYCLSPGSYKKLSQVEPIKESINAFCKRMHLFKGMFIESEGRNCQIIKISDGLIYVESDGTNFVIEDVKKITHVASHPIDTWVNTASKMDEWKNLDLRVGDSIKCYGQEYVINSFREDGLPLTINNEPIVWSPSEVILINGLHQSNFDKITLDYSTRPPVNRDDTIGYVVGEVISYATVFGFIGKSARLNNGKVVAPNVIYSINGNLTKYGRDYNASIEKEKADAKKASAPTHADIQNAFKNKSSNEIWKELNLRIGDVLTIDSHNFTVTSVDADTRLPRTYHNDTAITYSPKDIQAVNGVKISEWKRTEEKTSSQEDLLKLKLDNAKKDFALLDIRPGDTLSIGAVKYKVAEIKDGIPATINGIFITHHANNITHINESPVAQFDKSIETRMYSSFKFGTKIGDYVEVPVDGASGFVVGNTFDGFPVVEKQNRSRYVIFRKEFIRSINNKLTNFSDKATKIVDEKLVSEKENITSQAICEEASPFKKELTAAGYRVAATQSVNLSKAAIVSLLRSQGKSNEYIQGIAGLLDTEFGRSLISLSLGIGLTYASADGKPKLGKFAKECRIQSMTIMGNSIMDAVVGAALESLATEVEPLETTVSDNAVTNLDDFIEEDSNPKMMTL